MSDLDLANLRYQMFAVIKKRQCTNVSTWRIREKMNNGLCIKMNIHGTQLHFITRLRPSLCPQSSTMKLLEHPILLEKPSSHSPCSFLIRSPLPAQSGFPIATPSVFRQAHPAWGLSHLTCTNLLLPVFLAFKPQCWNSNARKRASLWTYG